MSHDASMMLIGGILIVRILVDRILLNVKAAYGQKMAFTHKAQENLNIIGQLIYAAFHYYYKDLPVYSGHDRGVNSTIEKVKLGRRIFYRNEESDSIELLNGMFAAEDIPYFLEDPDGYEKLRNYIVKLLWNVNKECASLYCRIHKNQIVWKLLKRRSLLQKLSVLMPEYVNKLLADERVIMEEEEIDIEELETTTIIEQ